MDKTCDPNYVWVERIERITDWRQQCCNQNYIRRANNDIDVKVMNESVVRRAMLSAATSTNSGECKMCSLVG